MSGLVIVTGGSRGIGAATARRLAKDGNDILINYRTDSTSAERVCKDVRDMGQRAEIVGADVATEAGIEAIFSAADEMGPLAGLVTNAGVGDQVSTVETFSYARVERLMRTNITGVIICAREAIKRMARKNGGGGGSIVNISSAAAKLGAPNQFVDYAATKGAIDTLTVGLALEWAGEGIRVNAVRPGVIATEFHSSVGLPGRPEKVGPGLPMGRAGTPEEVAEAVAWLMSDAASYSTGAIIDVSGGRSILP